MVSIILISFGCRFFIHVEFKSEMKYWQNMYHHLDRTSATDDALCTVSSSLSRQSLNLFPFNDLECARINFKRLLQVHTFHEEDIHKVQFLEHA